jgi:hypothetical protein
MKTAHSRVAALLVLVLSGCASSHTVMPFELTDADEVAIKAGVRTSLGNPGSAEFGDMRATRSTDGVVSVCGWVNSKNGVGRYTGNQLFIGLLNVATRPSICRFLGQGAMMERYYAARGGRSPPLRRRHWWCWTT